MQKFWHEDRVIFSMRVSMLSHFLERGEIFLRRFSIVTCIAFYARILCKVSTFFLGVVRVL